MAMELLLPRGVPRERRACGQRWPGLFAQRHLILIDVSAGHHDRPLRHDAMEEVTSRPEDDPVTTISGSGCISTFIRRSNTEDQQRRRCSSGKCDSVRDAEHTSRARDEAADATNFLGKT